MLDKAIEARVSSWLNGPYDAETKEKIRQLKKTNPDALVDCFYTDLSFGTGGLRALMGIGPNRINIYTIAMATQGLANYINQQKRSGEIPSLFVSFDSRNGSRLFAEKTAEVLLANQIRVYLTEELRPTPYVSFGTRYHHCTAGVMITASHNPAVYNGYKVYWSDGAQVVSPHDTGIIQEVRKIHDLSQVKTQSLKGEFLIRTGKELDQAYLTMVEGLQHFPEENRTHGKELKICYTSLHGTGITLVPEALKRWGFSNLCFVEQQIVPDGNFPTVSFPNPEYPETLKLGIEKLQKEHSDILIATDPDADRLGVVVLHKEKPTILTGNEIAAICVDFLCHGVLPKNGAFITTIVSTELIHTIAEAHNLSCFEVLTGFKYIGEKIEEWDKSFAHEFIFGAEESYGYLTNTHVRDKDALSASCLIAEIALRAKLQKRSLVDLLDTIYKKYGIFREGQLSINFPAEKAGIEQMTAKMQLLRANLPTTFCGQEVVLIEDYQSRIRHLIKTKKEEKLTLPKSDVLLMRFSNNSKIVIRPSGTEPKIKIYGAVQSKVHSVAECDAQLADLLNAAEKELQ